MTSARDTNATARCRVVVTGVVQGVGFRPFIHRLAGEFGLNGWVLNSTEGVVIEVEGKPDHLDRFVQAIPNDAPPRARVERVDRTDLPPIGYSSFAIEESRESEGQFVLISPDICTCDDCLREMLNPTDRRHRYPFINCTNCGPRFTLVKDIPYDRPKTTMACFPMCPECEREYHDPANRRFHAQPNACPVCGPNVWLVRGAGHQPSAVSGQLSAISYQLSAPGSPHPPFGQPLPEGEATTNPPLPLGEGGLVHEGSGSDVGATHASPWECGRLARDERIPDPPLRATDGAPNPPLRDDAAIQETHRLLASGAILAVKGIGGFHLACDATNDNAVAELRRRKRRSDKPFAVMAPDVETVATFCHLSDEERQLLESPQRPIVLLRRKDSSAISPLVAPNSRFLGVMLPYTPLHHLLLEPSEVSCQRSAVSYQKSAISDQQSESAPVEIQDSPRATRPRSQEVQLPAPSTQHSAPSTQNSEPVSQNPEPRTEKRPLALVMTSGNLSEEPIATGNREALERLGGLADAFLLHNRDIQVRCDDSVTRIFRGSEAVTRRSRGYAPFPVRLGFGLRDLLACGGELKSTFCITRGNYAFLSQHVGDLENAETLQSYVDSVEQFRRLFRLEIAAVAHDLHPEYLSTRFAWDLAEGGAKLPLVPVQHHHAHVAACMAENGVDEPVLGVSFDGTGYGDDGHLWGGEFLVCDFAGYRRAAHFKYLPLPGGEAAIRRPGRMAVSYLLDGFGPDILRADLPPIRAIDPAEAAVILKQVERGLNSPLTSSVGRLFDAVSALLGVRQVVNYEGQAAIELEMGAAEGIEDGYPWDTIPGEPAVIDPAPAIRRVVDEIRQGVPMGVISARFHNTVADIVAATCRRLRDETGIGLVALSGGVFQNLYLLERACRRLESGGFRVLTHHQVPANDGGIALGQAVVANRVLGSGF